MVNWSKYEEEILNLAKENYSSTDIAYILSQKHDEVSPTQDRAVRRVIQRAREESVEKVVEEKNTPAKVLLFDIETAPLITYLWRRSQQYPSPKMLLEDWYVINWAAKWLFEDEIISGVCTPEESKNRDDKRIVKKLWHLLDEADIVIAHYGDRFDIRMMNGRFLKYGLNLPMPYKSIDTKKFASKKMDLPSHSLDYIATYLGLENKHSTTFDLWIRCMEGDEPSLKYMDKYCRQDVKVLEDVYLKLRPFIQPHPNLGMYIEENKKTCPSCASTKLKKEGQYATTVNLYDAYRCQDCGSITRSRKTSLSKEDKESITSSVPR